MTWPIYHSLSATPDTSQMKCSLQCVTCRDGEVIQVVSVQKDEQTTLLIHYIIAEVFYRRNNLCRLRGPSHRSYINLSQILSQISSPILLSKSDRTFKSPEKHGEPQPEVQTCSTLILAALFCWAISPKITFTTIVCITVTKGLIK